MSDVVKNGSTTLSGKSEPDSTVTVFDGTKSLGTVTADGSGDWSFKPNSQAVLISSQKLRRTWRGILEIP